MSSLLTLRTLRGKTTLNCTLEDYNFVSAPLFSTPPFLELFLLFLGREVGLWHKKGTCALASNGIPM